MYDMEDIIHIILYVDTVYTTQEDLELVLIYIDKRIICGEGQCRMTLKKNCISIY